MKTKLLVLSGVTLAVLAAVAVAEKQISGKQFLPVGVISPISEEKPKPPLVITKDQNVLKGKGLFYTEGGTLYKEAIALDGTLATTSQTVAAGSVNLVDQNEDIVLFIKDITVPIEGVFGYTNELWVLDKRTGTTKKIRGNVIQEGSISPSEDIFVIRTIGNQLLVLTKDGSLIIEIPSHGISPTFSPDGKKVAYIRLKDGEIEMGDDSMFQGVAMYDFVSGKDSLVFKTAPGGNEYMITGWSPDGKRIYFPSGGSTWSVAIDGTGERWETGFPVPNYLTHLLFTDDGTTVFGEAGGVWAFNLGKDGRFLDAKKVVEGDPNASSRIDWLEKGKSIHARLYGKSSTTVYRISDLKR